MTKFQHFKYTNNVFTLLKEAKYIRYNYKFNREIFKYNYYNIGILK